MFIAIIYKTEIELRDQLRDLWINSKLIHNYFL